MKEDIKRAEVLRDWPAVPSRSTYACGHDIGGEVVPKFCPVCEQEGGYIPLLSIPSRSGEALKDLAQKIADVLQKRGRKASTGEPLYFDRRNLEDVVLSELGGVRDLLTARDTITAKCAELILERHNLEARVQQLEQERDGLNRALDNHLCPYDKADWIACAGGHGDPACEVCREVDRGQHRHQLLIRAEQAEALLADLRTLIRYAILLPNGVSDLTAIALDTETLLIDADRYQWIKVADLDARLSCLGIPLDKR